MKSYKEALEWIHSLLKFGIKPGLKRVEWLLERTGSPEKKIMCIHIAGTNGKGSTVEFIRSIMNEAGYSVGTFTSPYLISFNERVSLNRIPISDDELLHYARIVRPYVEEVSLTELGSPTEFEVITVISLLYFADKQPDIVVYETGLGGLYDSTNVITPILSLITNIGFDHMGILGDTLKEIAFQKAGIIKKDVPVITTADQKEAREVIEHKAKEMHAENYFLDHDFSVVHKESTNSGESFFYTDISDKKEINFEIAMKGTHQIKNAGLAVAAVKFLTRSRRFEISLSKLEDGLRKANWAGRFEKVSHSPDIILDGAHNEQGIAALKETLINHYGSKRIFLLFAALEDKAYATMMKDLLSVVYEACFTTFDFPRAASAEQLLKESPLENSYSISSWSDALQHLKDQLQQDDVLIITGSLYFISEIRKTFQNLE
ncbi:bifunctional folylpolyglutamate synthase/dihydrofolate synthase [Fictibacillus phosphorivorans]|uniref:bifunctional folylpolyglutamate synthase/dihydrofolate synthase n=1 Tax=Fictibacillus phosphorivorans TaxID=1221500 RepID=UPI001292E889|nr:folylpolyglutamate synthase/dihydrofolate synthase family protein [Fictibacillus phosphorivorans]MQR95400.1 bifunctional folylpolyglutamate synthase/dihydrofolate synthase [Fictibacillus phosphorivorans]